MQSSSALKIDQLFDDLSQSIDLKFEINEEAIPFHEWVENITLDGKPFTYERHEYLKTPYSDNHPHKTFIKATQMGLTALAMLWVVYCCRYLLYRGILYFFPSAVGVQKFSTGRLNPLIADNPEISSWVKSADSVTVKHIWNTFIYLLGMNSREGLKSTPGDLVIFDESDEAPQESFDMALKRMAHSEQKEVLMLSNPTLPDFGVDKAFQQTDQRYWLLKCPKCNHYTCLEDTFPDCLITTNGHVIRACQKCKGELNPSLGEWVAKRPRVTDKRGYHFSQLFSYFVEPKDILHEFRTIHRLTNFYNLTIGDAYVEAENRLSIEEVLALCGSDGIASSNSGPCFMGVDQGKDLHVVIGKKHPCAFGQTVHLGIYKDWEELDSLMSKFNVVRCVVDALPETRNARAFAERHKGKIYLNYYNEHQKGSYAWNDKEFIVQCNRTESLDASHKEISEEAIYLPKKCDITELFAEHLHNAAKKLEEDEQTGSKRYVYVKLGPDHFRHAYNYEAMARQNSPDLLFPEV